MFMRFISYLETGLQCHPTLRAEELVRSPIVGDQRHDLGTIAGD